MRRERDEMMTNIVSKYSKLAQKEYKIRLGEIDDPLGIVQNIES